MFIASSIEAEEKENEREWADRLTRMGRTLTARWRGEWSFVLHGDFSWQDIRDWVFDQRGRRIRFPFNWDARTAIVVVIVFFFFVVVFFDFFAFIIVIVIFRRFRVGRWTCWIRWRSDECRWMLEEKRIGVMKGKIRTGRQMMRTRWKRLIISIRSNEKKRRKSSTASHAERLTESRTILHYRSIDLPEVKRRCSVDERSITRFPFDQFLRIDLPNICWIPLDFRKIFAK